MKFLNKVGIKWRGWPVLAFCLLGSIKLAAGADPLSQWWWRNPLPPGSVLYGVAYGGDLFVAVGWSGTILTSTDGKSWQEQRAVTHALLQAVCYGAGRFVAVGQSGTILISTNGIGWMTQAD